MALAKKVYTAMVEASGADETWTVRSDDSRLDLQLAIPKELGGSALGTNPEQIFAAGYSACMHHTVKFYAKHKRQNVSGCTVNAAVSVGPVVGDPVAYEFAVHLVFRFPHLEQHAAEALVAKAHSVCPYSRLAADRIEVTEEIYGEA